jgi:hypothetical protein
VAGCTRRQQSASPAKPIGDRDLSDKRRRPTPDTSPLAGRDASQCSEKGIVLNICSFAGTLAALLVAVTPAKALDNLSIERLATCQDSWFEWKQRDQARLKNFVDSFQSDFLPKGSGAYIPKSNHIVAGLPVAQVFPQSIGMAVGFSVVVNANFEQTKKILETKAGKPFKCEPPSDNMRACELRIGEKKTIGLMAEDNVKSTTTLFGCYYFYEK